MYSWGINDCSQLGYELPQTVENSAMLQSAPRIVESLKARCIFIVDVTCGDNHSVATALDGTIYGWGSNQEGQLCISCVPG